MNPSWKKVGTSGQKAGPNRQTFSRAQWLQLDSGGRSQVLLRPEISLIYGKLKEKKKKKL